MIGAVVAGIEVGGTVVTGTVPLDTTVNVLDDVTTGSYPTLVVWSRFSRMSTRIVGSAGRPIEGSVAELVVP